MELAKRTCPHCGKLTAGGSQCDHCGKPLESSEKQQPWLKEGTAFEVALSGSALGLSGVDGDFTVELLCQEAWETFEDRRVFLAIPVEITGEAAEELSDDQRDAALELSFVVEEETQDEQIDNEETVTAFEGITRRPIYRNKRGDSRRVSVFKNDAGLALDEVMEVVASDLNPAQVKGVFLSILDAVEKLHTAGYLHLRLTPWTIRVKDDTDEAGLPLDFLSDSLAGAQSSADRTTEVLEETTAGSGLHDATGLSEYTEEDGPFEAEFGSDSGEDNEFLDHAQSTGELYVADTTQPPSEASEVETLSVLFDSVDGYFPSDADFDRVPVIMGFSPPELVGPARADISEACDIFNLGLVLYFLIAGELPPVSVYTRHLPAVPARNLRPDFPPGLQSVISRATRPNPEDRYPNVDEFREDFLEACEVMDVRLDAESTGPRRTKIAVDRHVGIAKGQRNPTNQDNVFAASSDDGRFSLVVVADGVSTATYGSGDLASEVLAEEAENAWEEILPTYLMDEEMDAPNIIRDILARANQRIVDYVNENHSPFHGGPHEVMGTTSLVAIVEDEFVTLGALGDSRVYLQRGASFEQMTVDHNLWTLSILEGMSADSALAMPHGDALARCLGTFVVEDGTLVAVAPEPDLFRFRVTSGDTLLLTTDGLVDFAGANAIAAEDNILNVLLSEPNPALACLELILLANRGGGGDNIGVGIVKFL
jgi:protein phosphatase